MAVLYIVATPIGNLKDITIRALNILKNVDLILCEDTRVTKKLLNHYQIETLVLSYHQHSRLSKIDYILSLLREGKNLALVSDAGTPGISDPGGKLIEAVGQIYSQNQRSPISRVDNGKGVKIIPVPGASAVTCAASISGFPMDKFLFLGFLPAKKKRKKFFEEIKNSKYPVILYESPYRVIKTLRELSSFIENRELVVCRELTKKFETIYRGKISQVMKKIGKDKARGEFTIVIESESRL